MENDVDPAAYDLPPIREMLVKDLIPDPDNPRIMPDEAAAGLMASFEKFGYVNPIIWNERSGHVVGGHQRLEVLKELGVEKTKVIVWHGDAASERALNVALNNPAIMGEWDDEKLIERLEQLREDLSDEDFLALRLDQLRLEVVDDQAGEGYTDPDDIPEAPEEPRTQPGDIWSLGPHRVMCGDSTSEEDVGRLMGGREADVAVTDPPYGVGVEYASFKDSEENARALINQIMPRLLEVPCVALTPGIPSMWWYPPPSWLLGWVHPASTSTSPWGFCNLNPILVYGKDPLLSAGMGRRPTCLVLAATREKDIDHPTPKPVAVWEWLIQRITPKRGALVFDPFLGSGTTLIAAERLGRICYGMEIEPRYVDVAVRRWEEYTGKEAVKVGPTDVQE